jgi:hypothetical protein
MDYTPDFHEEDEEIGLVRLSRVTYQLADGQPDAMGWCVADIDGQEFGRVSDLLADAMTGQIVFVAITSGDSGKTALMPVEGVYLDETQQRLWVPLPRCDVTGCPDFNDEVIDVMPFVDYWTTLGTAREARS